MSDTVVISNSSLDMSVHNIENISSAIRKKIDPTNFVKVEVNPVNKQGTENIEKLFGKIGDVITLCIDKFQDGFQFWDTLAVFSVTKHIMQAREYLAGAKQELNDHLTQDEVKRITKSFIDKALLFFNNIPATGEGAIGTTALQGLTGEIIEIFDTIAEALDDGLQAKDVKYIPDLFSDVVSAISYAPKSWIEGKDLTKEEIGVLFATIAGNIWTVIRRMQKRDDEKEN